jgi:hypothetical protein
LQGPSSDALQKRARAAAKSGGERDADARSGWLRRRKVRNENEKVSIEKTV